MDGFGDTPQRVDPAKTGAPGMIVGDSGPLDPDFSCSLRVFSLVAESLGDAHGF